VPRVKVMPNPVSANSMLCTASSLASWKACSENVVCP